MYNAACLYLDPAIFLKPSSGRFNPSLSHTVPHTVHFPFSAQSTTDKMYFLLFLSLLLGQDYYHQFWFRSNHYQTQGLTLIAFHSGTFGQETLPDFMLGEFQLETSEGFEDYLYEIGINWFNRKIACTLYPTTKEVNLLKLINCPGLTIKHSYAEDI